MIAWLEDNPLGRILAAVCGGLALVALLLAVIWGLPPPGGPFGAENENTEPLLEIPELAVNDPIEKYVVITERPAFNESRLPVIDTGIDENLEEDPEEDVDAPSYQ